MSSLHSLSWPAHIACQRVCLPQTWGGQWNQFCRKAMHNPEWVTAALKDCWTILGVVCAGKDEETYCEMCHGQACSWWTGCTRTLIIITSFSIFQTNVLHLERAHLYYGGANIY